MSFCPLYIKHVFAFLKIDYLVSYAKEFLHGGVYRKSGCRTGVCHLSAMLTNLASASSRL